MTGPISARTPVVGVDPGGRESGLVLRQGADVVHHVLLVREGPARSLPGSTYFREVIATALELRAEGDELGAGATVVAVEGLSEPNPHMGTIAVMGIMGTAAVFGAVVGVITDAVVVEPAGHGKAPMPAYPRQLQPTTGHGKGHDNLRHCRSAYDIARAGLIQASMAAAS